MVAHEVKELATTTARSTGEISEMISSLQHEAQEIASVINGIIDGINCVNEATGVVTSMIGSQRAAVEELDTSAHVAISQMELLLALSQDVDRRKHERVPATGPVRLFTHGTVIQVDLLDLSAGGMRCVLPRPSVLETDQEVGVDLPMGGEPRRLRARTLWRNQAEEHDQAGFTFISPTQEDQKALMQYVLFLADQAGGTIPSPP